MNNLGWWKLINSTQKVRTQLMTLALSLSCTLATPLSPLRTRRLNLRPSPPSFSLSSITTRMSSSIEGSNASGVDLDSIFKHKKIIRSKVRKTLKEMDPSQRALEEFLQIFQSLFWFLLLVIPSFTGITCLHVIDDAIQQMVLDASWFRSSRRLCAYISCRALREVDTSKVLSEILQASNKDSQALGGKTLYVPRVEDKNSHMRMLNICGIEDLIANSMDILEPAPVDSKGNQREDVLQASEPVDLFLLPGLAFDRSGRRLGRGGGYYDTFLRNYQQLANKRNWKQPLLVALSYSLQILDDGVIPITDNDVYVDVLVSPTGVIPISPAALHRMEHGV